MNRLSGGIATDSIFLTVVRVVNMGVSILITMILSKMFTLADYGTYSQATLIVSFTTSLTILGLTDGVNLFYNSENDKCKRQKIISTIFTLQCIIGVLGAIVMIIFRNQITLYFGNIALEPLIYYIAFSPVLTNLLAMYQVLYISIGKAKQIAYRNLLLSLAKFLGVGIAALVTKNIVTIFQIMLFVDVLQLLYFTYGFRSSEFKIEISISNFKLMRRILSYCLPLAGYILTNSLMRDMDKLIISKLSDTESLAIYSNSSKILPFDILTITFASVMIPYITKFITNGEFNKGQELYRVYLQLAYTTTWIFAAGALIVSPELIIFLYGDKYLVGHSIFVVFILVDMIRFANLSIVLRAKGKSKTLLIYSIVSLAINASLSLILFRAIGIIGPAIATLVVTLITNLVMLYQASRILQTGVKELLNFNRMTHFCVELVSVSGIAIIVRYLLINIIELNSIISLFIVYLIFVGVLFLLERKKVISLMRSMNRIKM